MEVTEYKPVYYAQAKEIYEKSFPQQERYITIDEMIQSENTEFLCLVHENQVLGIMYLIYYGEMIFVLYLAVNPECRAKGYGSYLLKWCLQKYNDKKMYLNIEKVSADAKDYEVRSKRLKFYQNNGFFITKYISKEAVEDFNILCNRPEVDISEYKELDKAVAEILGEPISNIEEIDTYGN